MNKALFRFLAGIAALVAIVTPEPASSGSFTSVNLLNSVLILQEEHHTGTFANTPVAAAKTEAVSSKAEVMPASQASTLPIGEHAKAIQSPK